MTALMTRQSSEMRKNRRYCLFESIFDSIAMHSDVIDVVTLRKYLTREQEKLNRFLELVRVGQLLMPPIGRQYQHALGAKFSIVRSVICTLLLQYSTKLRQLFRLYTRTGQAVMSQVGFLVAAEDCFMRTATLTASVSVQSQSGVLHRFVECCIADSIKGAAASILQQQQREQQKQVDGGAGAGAGAVSPAAALSRFLGEFFLRLGANYFVAIMTSLTLLFKYSATRV